ncbi:neuronal acetylcholine receptor subunit beta-3-like [Glandiceps talaboti]
MKNEVRFLLNPLVMVLTVAALCVVHADDESLLLEQLLTGYNKLTRPVYNRNDSIDVFLDLIIIKLVDIDVKFNIIKADTVLKQTCAFRFQPQLYNSKEVTLGLGETFDVDTGILFANFEWRILNMSTGVSSIYFFMDLGMKSIAHFTLELERSFPYYLMMVIIPSTTMSLLSLCTFWLPPDCGERISLCFSLLVALSVYQLLVADLVPTNSDGPSTLSIFIMSNMLIVCSTIVWSILMVNLQKNASTEHLPPLCIRKILSNKCCTPRRHKHKSAEMTLECLPHVYENKAEVCDDDTLDRNRMNSENSRRKRVDVSEPNDGKQETEMERARKHQRYQEKQKALDAAYYWSSLVKFIDRTLFIVYLIGFIILLLYYIILPAHGYRH